MAALKNAKHERFAQELAAGKSASEGYSIAGFRAHRGNATTLAHKQSIIERVAAILAAREAKETLAVEKAIEQAGIDKAWVITRLQEVAERSMQREAVIDEDGNPLGEYRFNAAGANKALELIGKELGMFIERKHIDQNVTLTDDREAINDIANIFGIPAAAGVADEPGRGRPVVRPQTH